MTPKDLLLLQRVQGRDRSAFAELYDLYGGVLYGLVSRVLEGDEKAAEVVLEEVFLSIWAGASTYDASKGTPCFWMLGIARQLALAHVPPSGKHAVHPGPPLRIRRPVPAEAITRKAACAAEERPHDEQPDPRSGEETLISLAYYKGWGVERIAEHRGLSVQVVRARMRAELMALRGTQVIHG